MAESDDFAKVKDSLEKLVQHNDRDAFLAGIGVIYNKVSVICGNPKNAGFRKFNKET